MNFHLLRFLFIFAICFMDASARVCSAFIDNVEVKGECKGVLKHGRFVGYHTNGMPSWVVHFKNDVLHGKFLHFFPSGKVQFSGSYKNGKLDGKFIQYNVDNDTLEAHFKHGVLHDWLYIKDSDNNKLQALKYYYGKPKLQKYMDY